MFSIYYHIYMRKSIAPDENGKCFYFFFQLDVSDWVDVPIVLEVSGQIIYCYFEGGDRQLR